jgi:hypothetical protein
MALLTNIRQGWKILPETNTLAYYEHYQIIDMKSFTIKGTEIGCYIQFLAYFLRPKIDKHTLG